ncbi:MAG TPA: GNAT family N-acetyltransferase [bacterium]|nr:GNAT family N-acetyltransferase [bacterium]
MRQLAGREIERSPARQPFRIRTGTVRDAPAIFALVRWLARYEGLKREVKATLPDLRRHGFRRRPYFHTLICWRGREPVGFALYFFAYSTFLARPTLYIEDLFVLSRCRRQGAGKALLTALARVAARKKCGRMEWVVLRGNTPAIRFYERLGATLRTEWILTRLTGAPLRRLAGSSRPGRAAVGDGNASRRSSPTAAR